MSNVGKKKILSPRLRRILGAYFNNSGYNRQVMQLHQGCSYLLLLAKNITAIIPTLITINAAGDDSPIFSNDACS